jgi:NTP pyrophosphatase (non-canonical NTP hydrolase)
MADSEKTELGVKEFQDQIEAIYLARDKSRGTLGTFAWLVEEVGELSRALRGSDRQNLEEEFADVFAWLVTLASLAEVDLASAAQKYAQGCPRCGATPCECRHREELEDLP